MKLTDEQLREILKRPGYSVEGARTTPKLERDPIVPALEAHPDQEAHTKRFLIRFESVRRRLIDPDNVQQKYLTDCLRYAGAIPDDSAKHVEIQTTQRKCAKGEEEHTMIEIYEEI